jgi:excisionase family DNA binding protein
LKVVAVRKSILPSFLRLQSTIFEAGQFTARWRISGRSTRRVFLDNREHFLHNRTASVARSEDRSPSTKMPFTLPLGTGVRLRQDAKGRNEIMFGRSAEEHMLTTEEVSKWLGIAQRTLCTWAECNEIPAIKIGRQWRFRRQEVMAWLERSGSSQSKRLRAI